MLLLQWVALSLFLTRAFGSVRHPQPQRSSDTSGTISRKLLQLSEPLFSHSLQSPAVADINACGRSFRIRMGDDRVQKSYRSGTIVGELHSSVLLVEHDDASSAILRYNDTVCQLVARGNRTVHETKLRLASMTENEHLPSRAVPEEFHLRSSSLRRVWNPWAPVVVDICLFYTARAMDMTGGRLGMENYASLIEQELNYEYANSHLSTTARVAFHKLVGYDETQSTWNQTLERLYRKADGYMDDIHDDREAHGCDIGVLMISSSPFSKIAGLGFVAATRQYAFTVVDATYAASFALGHELGHLFGCSHNLGSVGVPGLDRSSHGFVNEEDKVVTLMAYLQPTYSRLPLFSSPTKFNGKVVGDRRYANCAGTIKRRAPIVAGFAKHSTKLIQT